MAGQQHTDLWASSAPEFCGKNFPKGWVSNSTELFWEEICVEMLVPRLFHTKIAFLWIYYIQDRGWGSLDGVFHKYMLFYTASCSGNRRRSIHEHRNSWSSFIWTYRSQWRFWKYGINCMKTHCFYSAWLLSITCLSSSTASATVVSRIHSPASLSKSFPFENALVIN